MYVQRQIGDWLRKLKLGRWLWGVFDDQDIQ
jgi:hypothetical protein